ncbi:MAG: sigma-70 family RNA polymerase sigma factor [Anaerolineae bacterium]|nr:sigma-70 family RNA polymerase sigma factor [Anaerolineae bacterium]
MATLAPVRKIPFMPDLSTPELIVLAQRGAVEAIGVLYDVHCQAVFRYFKARLGDQQAAEDLTGEVFRRMLTSLPQYRMIDLPFQAWLFRIAHNLLVDHYRVESKRITVPLEETENASGDEIDPAMVIEQKLTIEHAYRVLSSLEPHQRDVLALRFLSGLSLKETALAMSKSEDAIKALQRRGLAALRLNLAMR